MTDKLLRKFKQKISNFSLAPFADGRFEVIVNGKTLFSKLETKQFPDEDAVLAELEKHA